LRGGSRRRLGEIEEVQIPPDEYPIRIDVSSDVCRRRQNPLVDLVEELVSKSSKETFLDARRAGFSGRFGEKKADPNSTLVIRVHHERGGLEKGGHRG